MKKGNMALFGLFVTGVIAVLLLANLFIPQVKNTTTLYSYTEYYNRTNSSLNQTTALTYYPVSTITITSGATTLPAANYTLDTETGSLMFEQNNAPALYYTIAYSYEQSNYLDSATDRSVMAMAVLAGMIGLVYWLFKAFGMTA